MREGTPCSRYQASPDLVLGDVERVHAAFDVMLQPIRPGVGELDGVLRRVGGDSGNLACGGRCADHGRPAAARRNRAASPLLAALTLARHPPIHAGTLNRVSRASPPGASEGRGGPVVLIVMSI